MLSARRLSLGLLLYPATAMADLPAMTCTLTDHCAAGTPCTETALDFDLEPAPGGYAASIDSDWVSLMQISPPEAAVKSFMAASPDSVTVLLSLFPDGALALTVQEDIDGPHVETAFGRCTRGS
ncbi:MAG: hypothetical protein IOD05_02645 [Rhodobacter sp.]|nr:hypothetical protein [Rhodobacter sp.]MCA3487927.1 hypothetical protein [Rhodobacter sp.]MCA3492665.1 hypothetical protein [Rhodobacter sp.]MCA3499802.1 hypothetical protein [Rhodobacter sp.]MCA3502162.1 hypothetical protein [Rhodobacter sp.]